MEAYAALLLISLLKIVVGEDDDISTISEWIVSPPKRCIPTAVQLGNCHVCVCKTDGVYHCRGMKCDMYKNTTDPKLPECAPNHTYRLDTLFCTCDPSGYWRSEHCKSRLYQMRPNPHTFTLRITTNIECIPQHFYISECNICSCESGYINFEYCTNRQCPDKSKLDFCNPGEIIRTNKEICACSDINYFIDRLCIKTTNDPIQEVDAKALDSIIDFGTFWEDLRVKCKPFYTYTIDCSLCFCDEYGNLFKCDYKLCENRRLDDATSLRASKPTEYFHALPELYSIEDSCMPGLKYRYRCNTCFCTSERIPLCTTMICLDEIEFTVQDLTTRQKTRNN